MSDPTAPLYPPPAPRPPRAPDGTARYYAKLPAAPAEHTTAAAETFYQAILPLFVAGVFEPPLTHMERSNLRRLANRWRRRAAGRDNRWNLVGARPGRLTEEEEKTYRKPDPVWSDPTWQP